VFAEAILVESAAVAGESRRFGTFESDAKDRAVRPTLLLPEGAWRDVDRPNL